MKPMHRFVRVVGNPHALGAKPLTFPRQVRRHMVSLRPRQVGRFCACC